jgi:hypothetical protein
LPGIWQAQAAKSPWDLRFSHGEDTIFLVSVKDSAGLGVQRYFSLDAEQVAAVKLVQEQGKGFELLSSEDVQAGQHHCRLLRFRFYAGQRPVTGLMIMAFHSGWGYTIAALTRNPTAANLWLLEQAVGGINFPEESSTLNH